MKECHKAEAGGEERGFQCPVNSSQKEALLGCLLRRATRGGGGCPLETKIKLGFCLGGSGFCRGIGRLVLFTLFICVVYFLYICLFYLSFLFIYLFVSPLFCLFIFYLHIYVWSFFYVFHLFVFTFSSKNKAGLTYTTGTF